MFVGRLRRRPRHSPSPKKTGYSCFGLIVGDDGPRKEDGKARLLRSDVYFRPMKPTFVNISRMMPSGQMAIFVAQITR